MNNKVLSTLIGLISVTCLLEAAMKSNIKIENYANPNINKENKIQEPQAAGKINAGVKSQNNIKNMQPIENSGDVLNKDTASHNSFKPGNPKEAASVKSTQLDKNIDQEPQKMRETPSILARKKDAIKRFFNKSKKRSSPVSSNSASISSQKQQKSNKNPKEKVSKLTERETKIVMDVMRVKSQYDLLLESIISDELNDIEDSIETNVALRSLIEGADDLNKKLEDIEKEKDKNKKNITERRLKSVLLQIISSKESNEIANKFAEINAGNETKEIRSIVEAFVRLHILLS